MTKYRIDFDEVAWEKPLQGIRCKVFKQGDRQLRLVEYSKEMPLHWCEKGHYGYILEGTFEIEYQGETIIYQTGDGVFIPDGKEHKHRGRVLSEIVRVLFVEDV